MPELCLIIVFTVLIVFSVLIVPFVFIVLIFDCKLQSVMPQGQPDFRSGGLNDAPMLPSLHRRREIRCGTKVFYAGLQITQLIDMESLSLRNCVTIETRKLPSMHFKSSKLRNDRALDSRHSG